MMKAAQFDRAIGDWAQLLPHPRFGVYRNNVSSALINALAVRFPVVEQLTGRDFFAAMARDYAAVHRPGSPVLIQYGAGFPSFISDYAAAAVVPYLADVARLESAWWHAYHAADATPLGPEPFGAVSPEEWDSMGFAFHPSLSMLTSPFAVGSIWQAHHGGAALGSFDRDESQCVLALRPFAEVELRIVAADAFAFLHALASGLTLGEAVEQVMDHYPEFSFSTHLAGLIGLNLITGLRP